MSSYTIVGRVGREPDLRFSANGVAVAKFSVAVSRGKKVNGEWEDVTVWHDVTCFNDLAENVSESLTTGDEVIAEGYLEEARSFEKKDGTIGVVLQFVANSLGLSLRWAPARAEKAAPRSSKRQAQRSVETPENTEPF